MRIHELKIKRFRNLRNFEITFTEDITMLLGKNGSAKSNLIEAIATIFSEIELGESPSFTYYLCYECQKRIVEIDAGFSQENCFRVKAGEEEIEYDSFVNEKAPPQFSEETAETVEVMDDDSSLYRHRKYTPYFPSNVFIYYSGLSDRLTKVCAPVKVRYEKELQEGSDPRLRRVFLTDGSHSSLILFVFFADATYEAGDFLRKRLGIIDLLSVRLHLSRPTWMAEAIKPIPSDRDYKYWYTGGRILETLHILQRHSIPLREVVEVKEWKRHGKMDSPYTSQPELQSLHFYFNKLYLPKNLTRDYITTEDDDLLMTEDGEFIFEESALRPKDYFQRLDDLRLAGYGLNIQFRLKLEKANEPISLTHLSEGEHQLLTVIGLLRFTKDNDTLFLLDEPDTHLNPEWSYEYKKLLEDATENASGSQIIMATHDPVLIAGLTKENVRLMERKGLAEAPDEAEWIIEARLPNEDPRGQGVARILEGELFDLPSALSAETLRDLERKRELAFKDELDPDEKTELRTLVRELRDVDLTQVIEDPLYTHFVHAVVKHPDYLRLKDTAQNEARFATLKRISEEVRDEMLRTAEGESQ